VHLVGFHYKNISTRTLWPPMAYLNTQQLIYHLALTSAVNTASSYCLCQHPK